MVFVQFCERSTKLNVTNCTLVNVSFFPFILVHLFLTHVSNEYLDTLLLNCVCMVARKVLFVLLEKCRVFV